MEELKDYWLRKVNELPYELPNEKYTTVGELLCKTPRISKEEMNELKKSMLLLND